MVRTDKCMGCGSQLETPVEPVGKDRPPCPVCGSTARHIEAEINENLSTIDSMATNQKRAGVRVGKKNKAILESFDGWSFNRDEQDWVYVTRSVDRLNDWYQEKVVTKGGRVLREVSHPLSEHQGRGAARPTE